MWVDYTILYKQLLETDDPFDIMEREWENPNFNKQEKHDYEKKKSEIGRFPGIRCRSHHSSKTY